MENPNSLFKDEEIKGDDEKKQPMMTIYTSKSGNLNKAIKNDGTKYAIASFSKGKFESIEVKSLDYLRRVINKLKPTQALGLGINKHYSKGDVLSHAEDSSKARSKENFKWSRGRNVVLLDYDYFKGMYECNSPSDFVNLLKQIDQVFVHAEMLVVPSSSSNIYKDGKLFLDSKGLHCYVIIDGDVNVFKNKLWSSCWAKGYGTVKFSKAGDILTRTIFDKSVFSPERLIFESKPTLDPGMMQGKIESVFIQGLSIDPEKMEDNFELGLQNEQEAKQKAKEESKELKDVYIKKETEKLLKEGFTTKEAIKNIKARAGEFGVIYTTDIITLTDGKKIKAGEINESHNGLYCLDPIEPDNAPAIINSSKDGQQRWIWSFQHGHKKFNIVEPNDDVQLEISQKAKDLAELYKNALWLNKYGFTYNEKLYENWEIKFQSYLEACDPKFRDIIRLIGTSAGNGKSTTLGFFTAEVIIPDPNKSVLIVVNTIRNARELQTTINELIPSDSKTKAIVLHSSDSKKDEDGNFIDKSDIKENEATKQRILIITHAKLQNATRNNDTKSIRYIEKNGDFFERDLTVIDEAIDFAETASIQLLNIKLCIPFLEHIIKYKNMKSAEKLKKVLEHIIQNEIKYTGRTLEPEELFGEYLNLKIEDDVVNELEKEFKKQNFNIKNFIKDLEILSSADGFVVDTGGRDGIVYSTSKDKLPSGKGIIILDASAVINTEYKQYITKKKAERIRVNHDARSYSNVTIHTAITRDSTGKIEVKKDDDESMIKLLNRQTTLIQEVMNKTTNEDKSLVIGNMDFINELKKSSFGGRNVVCEYWNNLTGRNDLRDCNKVFIVTLPYKTLLHSLNLAHKHDLYGEQKETQLLKFSNITDDIYQAIMRANLRKTQKYTTDAPKCDVYVVLPARTPVLRNLIVKKLKSLLIESKWQDWELVNNDGTTLFNVNPPFQPTETLVSIKEALIRWNKHNPQTLYVSLNDLSPIADCSTNTMRTSLAREVNSYGVQTYYGYSWVEDMVGNFKYVKGTDSKKELEKIGVYFKGRGSNIFLRKDIKE